MPQETVAVESASQEATSTENASVNNWDAITNAEEFNDAQFTPKTEDVKTDENQEGSDKSNEANDKTDENQENTNKEPEKTDANQEGAENKKPETPEEKPLIEFKAEDVVGSPEAEPEDGTFLALAKAQGIDLTEDSFEAYNKAVEQKYVSQIEEAKKVTEDVLLEKYSPEARATIDLLNSGLSLEQIYAPLQEINQLKQLDDVSLVRKALEEATMPDGSKMWDVETIEAQLEKLTENGKIETEAKAVRRLLEAEEQGIKIENENRLKKYQEGKVKQVEMQRQESNAKFEKAMSTVTEFMGGRLSDEAKQAIVRKQQSGAYNDLLNDPKTLAEFVLYKEFGPKAIKNIENTAFQRGRDEKTKKLANVPPVTQNGQGRVITNTQANNWDALKEGFGS